MSTTPDTRSDISPEAVGQLIDRLMNWVEMPNEGDPAIDSILEDIGPSIATLRAQAARITELEASLDTQSRRACEVGFEAGQYAALRKVAASTQSFPDFSGVRSPKEAFGEICEGCATVTLPEGIDLTGVERVPARPYPPLILDGWDFSGLDHISVTFSPPNIQHPDNAAVDRFAAAMKAKLAKKRADGRGGWEGPDCNAEFLSGLLREHVEKGDPLDVGNLAMMLHQRGETITPSSPAEAAKVLVNNIPEVHECWRKWGEAAHRGHEPYYIAQAWLRAIAGEEANG